MEAVSRVLTEHLTVLKSDKLVQQSNDKLAANRMYRTLLWGIITVIIGVVVLAIGKDYGFVSLLGVLISLAGMLLAVYGVLSPLKSMSISSGQSLQSETLKESEADLYLQPKNPSQLMPSVTEQTTELLEIENTRISKQ
jgi:hypothetical protein